MPPVGGIPFDCLDPTLDIPNEFSRRASIFNYSLGIPDSGARDRMSNPFGGSACDLSRLSWVRTLAYKGRKRPWRFAFLPVGRVFSGGSRCDTVSPYGGHRGAFRTHAKIWQCGFFWPTMYEDTREFIQRCGPSQGHGNVNSRGAIPLVNNLQIELFDVRGLIIWGHFRHQRNMSIS